MLDRNELKAEMIRKGYNQATLSEAIGITPRTFSSKMKKGNFGLDEMDAMIKVLEIRDPVLIFFKQTVT